MKKVIHKGNLNEIRNRPSENGLIVAIRSGKSIMLQNLELAGGIVTHEENDVVIRFTLKDGDCLVIQDEPGLAKKESL